MGRHRRREGRPRVTLKTLLLGKLLIFLGAVFKIAGSSSVVFFKLDKDIILNDVLKLYLDLLKSSLTSFKVE